MKKKFLALVMTLSMVLSLVPMTALAEEVAPAEEQVGALSQDEQQRELEVQEQDNEEKQEENEEEAEGESFSISSQEAGTPSYAVVGTTFTSETGVKYKVTADGEVSVTGCLDEVTDLVIPQNVTYEGLTYTVDSIQNGAFDFYLNINGRYPNQNLKITKVDLSEASIKIGDQAFRAQAQLTEVIGMDNITEISDAAFNGCKVLKKVSDLSALTSIGDRAFMNCPELAELDGIEWSSLTYIGRQAFQFYSTSDPELTSSLKLELTENTFQSLTSIGEGAFSGCSGVTGKVVFPESITEIPNSVFSGTGITDVDFSHVTSIGNSAFSNCAGLTELKLSDSVTAIGDSAFSGTGISGELVLPDSITKIGSSAFSGTNISSFVLPCNITNVGQSLFKGCEKLTGILVIPEGITVIGSSAFADTNYTEVNLPDSLTEIGASAFARCTSLTTVQIGVQGGESSQLTEIGSRAFEDDNAITSFRIEASDGDVKIAPNRKLGSKTLFTIPEGVTVEFAVKVKGGNIDTDGTETTLQEVINAVEENGTATITPDKSFFVDDTVTIPAGKTITLTDNGTGLSILTKSGFNKPLFVVEKDAKLILSGAFTYPCFRMTSGVFAQVKGDLILESGTISRLSGGQTDTGVIDVDGGLFTMKGGTISEITGSGSGYGAVYVQNGGTFRMNGGEISDCKVKNQYSGAVVLAEGTMTMDKGEIDGNTATEFNSAGGVLVNNASTFTMAGGTISNNSAKRGGGVLVRENGQFIMSKGTISGNTARVESDSIAQPNAGGGGVFVEHNASFNMTDGTITGNTTNGMGGGVATAVLNENDKTGGGQFHMKGGTISNNKASCGGGVYSWSGKDRVVLERGNIVDNTASRQGGGVYVSHDPWAITIQNALVTKNTATIQGGGIWACPKGTVDLGTDIAIFENSAGESADDAAFLLKWTDAYSTSFTNQLYGGGIVTWYRDTSISHGDPNYGAYGVPRFDASDPGNPVGLVSGDIKGYGLKAVVSEESKALAETAPLKITGNKAQRGGGIGTNGEVTVPGDLPGNTSVTVHKVWSGNNGNYPSTVKVNLVRTKEDKSQTIATVILSEKSKDKDGNAWSYTFSNLDNTYTYTVTEDEVSGYRTSITKDTKTEEKTDGTEIIPDNNVSFTITNTRKGGGGSGGGGSITIPDDVPTGLDLKNHYGYIIGYPVDYYTGKPTTDQTKKPVRPEGKITRAEVATIYFRMLTDENRAANWNQVSSFSDVKSSAWYNNAISTLTKAGILKGYEDGTFQPNGYITRAEFATIAIRFFSGVYEGEDLFPDIKGHWAEDYINNAANKGLVKGYEDGTFGPDRYITRAEAVTLVNRTLNRHPHNDGLHKDMLVWPDNMDTSKWYYADMQEATNSHEPDKDKTTADKEYWGKMLPIRDWEALEKEWSNANSAPGEGEVV